MDSFHCHLDELERLLSGDDMEKRQIKESVLCYAAHLGSTPVVEALIEKGVGKVFCNENCIIYIMCTSPTQDCHMGIIIHISRQIAQRGEQYYM